MRTKHTPGPWHVRNEMDYPAGTWIQGPPDADGWEREICKIGCAYTTEIRKTNARLIAAAPELAEALWRVRGELRIYETTPKSQLLQDGWRFAMTQATAALEKAGIEA